MTPAQGWTPGPAPHVHRRLPGRTECWDGSRWAPCPGHPGRPARSPDVPRTSPCPADPLHVRSWVEDRSRWSCPGCEAQRARDRRAAAEPVAECGHPVSRVRRYTSGRRCLECQAEAYRAAVPPRVA